MLSQIPLRAVMATGLMTLACCMSAGAQTVYRIVGPDGKVSFSDQPPPPSAPGKATVSGARGAATGGGVPLPYDLQQIVRQFPVTLYTGEKCNPCASARNLLVGRGVPFTERTINTNEDIDALQRISGEQSLPFGTIGGQQLKGFSDVEWSQYLDAAAYPKASQLPPNYRNPPATPLVAVKVAEPPAVAQPSPAVPSPADAVPRSAPAATNPRGIQF